MQHTFSSANHSWIQCFKPKPSVVCIELASGKRYNWLATSTEYGTRTSVLFIYLVLLLIDVRLLLSGTRQRWDSLLWFVWAKAIRRRRCTEAYSLKGHREWPRGCWYHYDINRRYKGTESIRRGCHARGLEVLFPESKANERRAFCWWTLSFYLHTRPLQCFIWHVELKMHAVVQRNMDICTSFSEWNHSVKRDLLAPHEDYWK